MGLKEDLIRIMSIVMLGEDPDTYINDIKEILRLFDELDGYKDIFERSEPLYHPLETTGLPRIDKYVDSGIDVASITKYLYDRYVSMPPIKGVKRVRRGEG